MSALDNLLERRDKEEELTPLEEAIIRDWGEWLDLERSEPAAAELAAMREAIEAARTLCKYTREHMDVTLSDALIVADVETKLKRAK